MGSFIDDLRYGFRMLRRTPLLSLVAVLTIALGVGLTTHTFSVVYGTVLRGVPIRDSDRFMTVMENDLAEGITRTFSSELGAVASTNMSPSSTTM